MKAVGFRQCDSRWPPLWETGEQPPGRWHGPGEGPVQYLADTADGAWAELVRHEELSSPEDYDGVARALWAIEVPAAPTRRPMLPQRVLTGGTSSYPRCRAEASRLRRHGATALVAPSAALLPGQAHGWTVSRRKVRPGRPRDGKVWVYFGPRPGFVGWCAAVAGPPVDLAGRVRFR